MLNQTESLYGFAAWLTCRKEKIVMSSTDNAAPVAAAVAEFVKANGLPKHCRDGWEEELKQPPMDK